MEVERVRRLIAGLQARAQPPLPAGSIALRIGGVLVGQVLPEVARFVADQIDGFVLNDDGLTLADGALDVSARTALVAHAATTLRAAGLIPGWRNELVCIGTPPLATIERAACRPLGITTQAVHLNAYTAANNVFVARRASHKQIDPGLWDNLVGGMVTAGESLQQALTREAIEEAGLDLNGVELQRGRWFQMRRPVAEGLQSEIIHVYDTQLPAEISLRNQDGEVEAIARRTLTEVIEAIDAGDFTLEAALVMLESVVRRHHIETPAGFFNDYEASSIHAI